MNSLPLIAGLLIYVVTCRLAMRRSTGQVREMLLAVCNLGGVFWCWFHVAHERYAVLRFGIYAGLVLFQFVMLRLFAERKGRMSWLAFYAPIAVLIVVRYIPLPFFMAFAKPFGLVWRGNQQYLALIGISYLAFRCSRLVLEVRNGSARCPWLWEYLNFAFFVPTMSVGPINTYANYRRGFEGEPLDFPVGRAFLRILVGLVKCEFLGGLLNQLTYAGFLLDEHPHPRMDLPLTMMCYYLFLYCNFSGFCDVAVGTAALIGIPVPENFDNPFAARNVKDFWNRWHITLSVWMRDVVFSPLSKWLVHVLGVGRANHAIALAITVVFLLVGVWHGVGWNFAAFGAMHALGVVVNHYYTLWLKKRLGRAGFKAYNENRWIHAGAVGLTFCYVAASLFLFASTFSDMKKIFAILR
jgi:D-alanyl-lipoteichoic acid acyltransferase DltB (MBOAT superfamily)